MRFKKVLIFLLVLVCIPCIFLFVGCGEDKKIKVRVFDNYVQWSYEGEDSWYNAISVDEIKQTLGETYKGDAGINGKQVEFRTNEDYLQWRYVGDSVWKNLIAIKDLMGTSTDDNQNTNSDYNENANIVFFDIQDVFVSIDCGKDNIKLENINYDSYVNKYIFPSFSKDLEQSFFLTIENLASKDVYTHLSYELKNQDNIITDIKVYSGGYNSLEENINFIVGENYKIEAKNKITYKINLSFQSVDCIETNTIKIFLGISF